MATNTSEQDKGNENGNPQTHGRNEGRAVHPSGDGLYLIANCIQLPKVNMAESSIGVLLLVVITGLRHSGFGTCRAFVFSRWSFGYRSSQWLSRCRASSGDWVIHYTKQVGFLPITTPVLAYCGLSLGKDIDAFKRLSWRIVPVALAVGAGSFICATVLAEIIRILKASSDALR